MRRQAEIVQLKQSLSENSFELAQIVGHRLKGHGETFGFPHISSIGISMEIAAKNEDMEKLREALNALDESVESSIKSLGGE